MKKNNRVFAALLMLAFIVMSSSSGFAQSKRKLAKLKRAQEYKLLQMKQKIEQEKLQDKLDLQAEKKTAVKKYQSQGFDVTPGSLPMASQLRKVWEKLDEVDDKENPVWMWADGNGLAQTQGAAELAALAKAKLALAGKLQSEVRGIIETSIATQQLDANTAATVDKVVAGAKELISASLSNVRTAFKVYKRVGNNIEVSVKVIYNRNTAVESAKKTIKKKLAEETDLIQDKLDAMLDLN